MAKPLSRTEVLGNLRGRHTKQASTLLTLIENRTAYQLAESQQAAAGYPPATTSHARAQSYLEAMAQGRARTHQPTIRDLERYASTWAELAPESAPLRATVAHLLGANYRFTRRVTPGIHAALGLATPAVQQAYQQQYAQPLAGIYVPRLGLIEQGRWFWARLAGWLENLSPFWTAFALTLTETVGASTLALPIALAGVGPLAGVGLIIGLGLINLLTMAGLVEAIVRNGNMRYGHSYFGQLVHDYLGRIGAVVFTSALLLLVFLLLLAYYTGFATALAETTHLPATLWAGLLFVVGLYFLRRRSLDTTIASAFVVGAVNLSIVLGLALLTLPHVRLENLQYVNLPFIQGRPFDAAILQLIFGVVLASFFGHTSPASMAKVVLRRDPSGRTLHAGAAAAIAVSMLIYSLWVFAVNGTLAPALLANTTGTALTPLAGLLGPFVLVFGSIYVVLGMGMSSIYFSLALFNQVQEWLPKTGGTKPGDAPARQGWRTWLLQRNVRFGLGVLPILLIVLLIEWLLFTGRGSFTAIFSFLGIITVPILAGIFPMLLLYASRRKGDYIPGVVWRFLGHPIAMVVVYAVFLAAIFLHGLWIWTDPFQRSVAVLIGIGLIIFTILLLRRGAFAARTVIEVRMTPGGGGKANFQIVAQGRPLTATVQIRKTQGQEERRAAHGEIANGNQLIALSFQLPASAATLLKVWTHSVSVEGDAVGLSTQVTVNGAGQSSHVAHTTRATQGQLTIPINGAACQVEIAFERGKE